MLPGTNLSNALLTGEHTALEILDKKDSSAGAVLKGTAGHNMWARGKLLSGTPAMTSHHVTMKAPVCRKNFSSTSG